MGDHTPGPWAIFYDSGINTIMPAMREGTIADGIKNDADAYLIAAAPGLLAPAKCLRQHLALFCGPDDAIATEIFRIADMAIAKAERTP